ncbi:MAG: glutamate 5-kinase [Pseudomonadota bacterium]
MKEVELRRKFVVSARRLVIKIGSGVLTGPDGLNTRIIGRLAGQIWSCRNQGREVILVSSGAVASGFKKVGLREKPKTVQHFQACAAIGQAGLMLAWEKALARRGHRVAQVLLTADDLSNRRRYLNARNTLITLLAWKVIPIINENDTVVVDELKFGDNDTLAGLVTSLVEADLLINLTDLDGLYDRDPRRDKNACLIPVVESVGPRIEALASGIPGALGAGGMYTKVLAAKRVASRGVPSIIANGKKNGILEALFSGRPEGTLFLPRSETLSQRKNWIAFAAKPKGSIVVDEGAAGALLRKGKSLLPPGVLKVEGRFACGDAVKVLGPDGAQVAVGLTNYSAEELKFIMGCRTCDIEARLGYKNSDEVIHRDNLVVSDDRKT